MSVLATLGAWVATSVVGADTQARLRLHLLDTVGALVAGTTLPEAAELARLAPVLDPLARRVAIARATEIDDIHLRSCTTPGAIVVPVAISVAAGRQTVGAADFAAALQAGYGLMTWAGVALAGPTLLYRGIWPTYLLAPLGAAAVAARLLRLDAATTADALAIALCRVSGGPGAHGGTHGGAVAGASPRWLLAGEAARAGVLAAFAAQAGFTGDRSLLDGDWLTRVHGIVPAELHAPMPADGGVSALSMKPVCAAKQTQAAIDGFRQILATGVAPATIEQITVGVPAAYQAMTGHRRVAGRTDRLTGIAYLLAIAAEAPDDLFDIARRRDGDEPRIADFMRRVAVLTDDSLASFYPHTWPARVRVTLHGGTMIERLVTIAEGDPERALNECAVKTKFHQLTSRVLRPDHQTALGVASLGATSEDAGVFRLIDEIGLVI